MLLLADCQGDAAANTAMETFPTPFSTEAVPSNGDSVLAPLPARIALDERKVVLGKRLFVDPRLSGDGKVACADCHARDHGGANGHRFSDLPGRKPVAVNVPSIFNAAFNFRFGWNGKFEDVGQQLDAAMQNPAAMGNTWVKAAAALAGDGDCVEAFARSYPEGLTALSLREALAIYSLSLVTPDSRFDRHLRGEMALAPQEQHGYDLFREYGCVSCHQGINVGGNLLQRFGVMADYFAGRNLTSADSGLYAVSGRDEDRFVFRVPSLRNVALTAPYFHDGSADTLEEAATTMARYQLGRALSDEQANQIAAFLRTLTGELDGKPL